MQIPLFGTSLPARSVAVSEQVRVNCYPELSKNADRAQVTFYGTPGSVSFSAIGAQPVRGMLVYGDLLYCVVGSTFYEVNAAGTATSRGSIATGAGNVSMACNGTQIMVVDGSATGYIYTIATTTLAAIADADFTGANQVVFLGGYFAFDRRGTTEYGVSDLYDGTTYDALAYASAETNPDKIVSIAELNGQLWLFGPFSTEVHTITGATDFPFAWAQGAAMTYGCAARWSVAKCDNTLFWLATPPGGGTPMVVRATGANSALRVSDHDLENEIAGYGAVADAIAYSWQHKGHNFYVLSFPGANKTWVYDAATQAWFQWKTGTGRHLSQYYARLGGFHVVGGWDTGTLYLLDDESYTDDGTAIIRMIRSRHVFNVDRPLEHSCLQINMESGVGLENGQGSDPQLMLRWKDENRDWSNEHWASVGGVGQRGTRVRYRRLGQSVDRIYEVSMSDPVKFVVLDATLNPEH